MSVRYQVFLSSTYRDLIDERRAVADAILQMGHFPAGMELFPASNDDVWKTIRKSIDDSDYYVLIVGARYGSMYSGRTSFTEHEYKYASGAGIPILPFLLEDSIAAERQEERKTAKKRLASFRRRLRTTHSPQFWRGATDLVRSVSMSLTAQINSVPRPGWVRARPETLPVPANVAAARPIRSPAPAVTDNRLVLPGGFDPTAARDVLAGKADRIASFAVWGDTPQGHLFWSAQKKLLEAGHCLEPDARDAILKWLDEAERAAAASPAPRRP